MALQVGDKAMVIGFCPDEWRGKIVRVVTIDDSVKNLVIWVSIKNDARKVININMRGLQELPKCVTSEGKLTVAQLAAWLLKLPNQDALVLYRKYSDYDFMELQQIYEENGIFIDNEANVMKVRPKWWDVYKQGELPQPIDVLIFPGN